MKILCPPSSGSIAGTTFSHNRAGQYTRNRRTPVIGTRTTRQAIVKANFTQASQAWQSLDAAQQAAWISYATAHPIVDSLGQSIKLTGSQYFIKCQAALYNVNGGDITDPPVSSAVTPVGLVSWYVDATPTAIAVMTAGSVGDFIAAAVSKWTSLGVNFQKTFSQVLSQDAGIAIVDVTDGLVAFAGTASIGTKAWLKLTPINSDGLTGNAEIAQTRVVAPSGIVAPVNTAGIAGHGIATFAGGPSPATLVWYVGSSSAGPFSMHSVIPGATSPTNTAGFTTGSWVTSRLIDPATGEASTTGAAAHIV